MALNNLSEDSLQKLAKDIAMEKVFCSYFLKPSEQQNLLGSIFMPLLFGAVEKEDIDNLGFVCEYYDQAGPRAINGYPMFFSCQLITKHDAEKIVAKVDSIRKLLDRL